jgi:hypothetical protein
MPDYQYEDHLIRIESGVIEQFSRSIVGSMRTPIAWASVKLEARKHDMVRVQIGVASGPDSPFFSDIDFMSPAFTFEIPAGEEPRLRAFLADAAQAAGRTT